MVAIDTESDLDYYESIFGELWESAVLTCSIIEVNDNLHVPNAEIIFSHEKREPGERTLYSEGRFKIVEKSFDKTFELLWDLAKGESVFGKGVEIELLEHRPEQRFLDDRESRVFERRPRTEMHAVFKIDISEDIEQEYNQTIDELQDELQQADEPYFHVGRCEYYYFDHHFRGKAKTGSEILVFADTGIEFEVAEENSVSVVLPKEIVEHTAVSVLPQRPYGTRKGWRIDLADQELEETDDGRVEFIETLDLTDVEVTYIILFVGKEILGFEEYHTPIYLSSGERLRSLNFRHRILDEYDQRDSFQEYLQGYDPDVFEIAVLNLFSTAGYNVQWFGEQDFKIPDWSRDTDSIEYDEIDIIAHRPDGTQILFIECTNKGISEKESILDRAHRIAAAVGIEQYEDVEQQLFDESRRKIVPVVATPQKPEELSPGIVQDFTNKGIVVLDGDKLTKILDVSSEVVGPVNVDIEPEMWDIEVF